MNDSLQRGKEIYLPCHISRGGFASERIFEILLPDGDAYRGAGPSQYLFTHEKKPIGLLPLGSQPIDGFVTTRLVKVEEDDLVLSIPSGEIIHYPRTAPMFDLEIGSDVLIES